MTAKLLGATISLTVLSAFAADTVPGNYSVSCWDGTFAYNRLEVQANDGKLEVSSEGSKK